MSISSPGRRGVGIAVHWGKVLGWRAARNSAAVIQHSLAQQPFGAAAGKDSTAFRIML